MKFVIATRNAHKLEEIRAIFDTPSTMLSTGESLDVLSALDFPNVPDTIEDRDTLEGNAIKKAQELCDATGLMTLADDSGLEVEAMDGAPGVYSARYAGEPCDYENNNAKLLRELAGQNNRRARFRTVMALARPGEEPLTVEGKCEGTIIDELRGEHGFGYDPLFVPDGFDQTFAELPAETKNKISHRARALAAFSNLWMSIA
ncbi:MAG: RdgB/HAM1 family non-canonical purine NTP pyrophosphatase [Kiritimatiellales bacterium]|nr:RdgB/HAM1 family non-canonical purine NTP pyrophosphatase [Kiritimatiellota bacterium]MBL7011649.1 RdgB/HAM1 family non-canonical purine NTP pyrophosphatase [Kiritimatiellales bacterium]